MKILLRKQQPKKPWESSGEDAYVNVGLLLSTPLLNEIDRVSPVVVVLIPRWIDCSWTLEPTHDFGRA